MERTVSAFDVRRQLGAVLEDVSARGERVVVSRHGRPIAAIVPISVYEQWKAERDRFFATLRAMAERANLDPDEADALAEEAVNATRQSVR
jgi:prevent-host-death family protein